MFLRLECSEEEEGGGRNRTTDTPSLHLTIYVCMEMSHGGTWSKCWLGMIQHLVKVEFKVAVHIQTENRNGSL